MSSSRARFLSIWNGAATIIFFAGIILGFNYLGYSGFILALFMWIIGGTVANMIFGPEKRKRESDKPRSKEGFVAPVEYGSTDKQFCTACGNEFPSEDQFCPECGTAAVGKSVPQ